MFLSIVIRSPHSSQVEPLTLDESADSYLLSNSSGTIGVRLQKRVQYPATFCRQIERDSFELGYGIYGQSGNHEFLHIIVKNSGYVRIQRDTLATLPLFYGRSEGMFIVSNQYKAVVDALPRLTTSRERLADALLPGLYTKAPLWNEIDSLDEQEVAIYDKGALDVQRGAGRRWHTTREAPPSDPSLFFEKLEGRFHELMDRYGGGQPFGFQMSGGVDSSVMPLHIGKKTPQPVWHGSSLLVPGQARLTQEHKLQKIMDLNPHAVMHPVALDSERNFPLSDILATNTIEPFYTASDIYTVALDQQASALQAAGVKTVFTGLGGDDAFEETDSYEAVLGFGHEGRTRRLENQLPHFFTSNFVQSIVASIPDTPSRPLPLLSVATVGPQSSYNIFIERGMWPASPYLDESFFNYCQGLPLKFRLGKKILRAYCQANGFPKVIYDGSTTNEDFSEFFNESFLSDTIAYLIRMYAHDAICERIGLVRTDSIGFFYELMRKNGVMEQTSFWLYIWLIVELNLRWAEAVGKYKPSLIC